MFLSAASLGLRAFGGVTSVIQGGKFQSGFLAAGFSEFAGPHIDKMSIGVLGKGIASSMVGGVASKLGGGKFENGAITSAFSYMYNACLHGQCTGEFGLPSWAEQGLFDYMPGFATAGCVVSAAGFGNWECSGVETGGHLMKTGGYFLTAGGANFIWKSFNATDRFLSDREPQSLLDEMTLDAAQHGAGESRMYNLGDGKYSGSEKWQYSVKSQNGNSSTVHYVRDPKTGALEDFKFKR